MEHRCCRKSHDALSGAVSRLNENLRRTWATLVVIAVQQVFRVQRRWAQTLQQCQAASGQADEGTPWRTALGFQCNERYLDWDESAARRCVCAPHCLGLQHPPHCFAFILALGLTSARPPSRGPTRRLIKIYVAQKLDKSVEWVDEKLLELGTLIPDLGLKLDRMKADLVLQVWLTPSVLAALPESSRRIVLCPAAWAVCSSCR